MINIDSSELPLSMAHALSPDLPEGHITGSPDFVGIGAQKSGTSWWYHLISSHPKVHRPKLTTCGRPLLHYMDKERHFFNRFFIESFLEQHSEEYKTWFPRPKDKITGEWTPRYLVDHWVPPLLRRAAPQTKLLVMLRDPVERFISGLGHAARKVNVVAPSNALEGCWRGFYFKQLQHWQKYFNPSSFLLLQYEKCVLDPMTELKRTFDFLEIETADFSIGKSELFQKINEAKPQTKPVLQPSHIRTLVEMYSEDMKQLAQAYPSAIDLSLWKRLAVSN